MTAVALSPSPKLQFFGTDGNPLVGGKVYTYAAGTTTLLATYVDSAGVTVNTNPIILDTRGEANIWLTSAAYKFVLKTSTDTLIWTVDNITNIETFKADLANTSDVAKGDALVGFRQSNASGLLANSVGQTVHRKLQETVSVFDFMTQAQITDVQGGTYALDVTTACQNALNSGATRVVFPSGSYKITGLTIGSTNPNLRDIEGQGLVTLRVTAASNAVGFSVAASRFFVNFNNFYLISTGTLSDGFTTYGILFVGSNAYTTAKNIRADNFSGAGMEWRQTVYTGVENYVCSGCRYGLSFQPYSVVPTAATTTVTVDRAYITGCTRGLFQTSAVAMEYRDVIVEYSGSSTTMDGAFHLAGGQCQLIYPYAEANARNLVAVDAEFNVLNKYFLTATAADSITYVGTAFGERGIVTVLPYTIQTPRIGPDTTGNYDCVIGTNLTAPLAGGSVIFGNETMYSATGTLTNAAWTTAYVIPAAESTGAAANAKALYEYTCYAGAADLSTGFDAGTIMNGTLRSYSGTTPAWLRLAGGALSSVVITGTAGQFSCTATVLTVGMAVVISGTFGGTGSITGYTDPTTYYIIATNGTTTFTLSTTAGGTAVATTAGTPTGLSYSLNGNVQMNVTSSSYGLTYKIVMRRVYPG
jgi:hypothetical protein